VTENHTHIRDEQFWFTAAVVGFNTFVLGRDSGALPAFFLVLASATISIFGIHLILTRWVKNAIDGGRITAPPFNNKTATARQRASYTWWEIRAYGRDFGYIVAELSGSSFYLLLIIFTFVGVVIRYLSCEPYA